MTATNVIVTEPAVEPVGVEEVKEQAFITDDTEDAAIRTMYIPAARKWVEQRSGRSLITQTRRQNYDTFPTSPIYLRYGPVQSITSVLYQDTSNVQQTLAASKYGLDADSWPARLYEAYNETWPTSLTIEASVKITYVAGYGTAPGLVPATYRDAIIKLAAHFWEHRGVCSIDGDLLNSLEAYLAAEGLQMEYS